MWNRSGQAGGGVGVDHRVGRDELAGGTSVLGRVRRPGGGRKPAGERDPGLVPVLEALIELREFGDPVSPVRWTTASLRALARELTAAGHPVSVPVVASLLRAMGFSLQGMAKTRAGSQVPDRCPVPLPASPGGGGRHREQLAGGRRAWVERPVHEEGRPPGPATGAALAPTARSKLGPKRRRAVTPER
jgi:hypothetical protein